MGKEGGGWREWTRSFMSKRAELEDIVRVDDMKEMKKTRIEGGADPEDYLTAKLRNIDGGSRFRQNDTVSLSEKLDMGGVEEAPDGGGDRDR